MKIVDKPCERCGEMMFSVASIQKYCQTCRKAVEVEYRKVENEKRREERKSNAVEKRCEFCGKTFKTSRGNKIWKTLDQGHSAESNYIEKREARRSRRKKRKSEFF